MTKTRQWVPILLNGRLVGLFLENEEPSISMEIPMRRYPYANGQDGPWEPVQVLTAFRRDTKIWPDQGVRSKERAVETLYTCTNPRVTFEDETVPVIR